jgi:hypothetical protein
MIQSEVIGIMEMDLIDQISHDANVDRETLVSLGIRSFLKDKKTALLLERLELLSRYRATSGEDLQSKIEAGEIDDHPAWEDLILIENLEAELKRIDGYIEHL